MSPSEILHKAASLVSGERAKQHGYYVLLHQRVADLWSTYLKTEVRPDQVAMCMVFLKLVRNELGSFNPDDGVDATAYTALWAAITEEKNA